MFLTKYIRIIFKFHMLFNFLVYKVSVNKLTKKIELKTILVQPISIDKLTSFSRQLVN